MKKKTQKTVNPIPANMTPQAILKKAVNYHLNGQKKQSPNFDEAYKSALMLKFYYDLDEKYLKLVKEVPNDWLGFFEFFRHITILIGNTGENDYLMRHIKSIADKEKLKETDQLIQDDLSELGIFERVIDAYKDKSDWKSLLELQKLLFIMRNDSSSDVRKEGWFRLMEETINDMELKETKKEDRKQQ